MKQNNNIADRLRDWWSGRKATILRLAILLMGLAAIIWLTYEYWRLLWQPDFIGSRPVHPGAIDFKGFYQMVQDWFHLRPDGSPMKSWGVYPPASQIMLWPFFGWLNISQALILWTLVTTVSLGGLVWLSVRESGADTVPERILAGLIPLSMYAVGATIGNGQLPTVIVFALAAGLLMLRREDAGFGTDLAAALLILLSLIKPTLSAPFFWIVLFVPGRLRPAMLVVGGYLALTALAISLSAPPPPHAVTKPSSSAITTPADKSAPQKPLSESELPIQGLLQQGSKVSGNVVNWLRAGSQWSGRHGHANLHVWLESLGWRQWSIPGSLLVLAILGGWTYSHRRTDLWVLIGVAALAARFWIYHRWYDDLLILLPMIALFRIAGRGRSVYGIDVWAGVLLGMAILVSIAPGGLYLLPPPLNGIYVSVQIAVWTTTLIFLVACARLEKRGYLQ